MLYSFKLTALAIGIFSENSSFLDVFTDISFSNAQLCYPAQDPSGPVNPVGSLFSA